jgi:hypothetical protein
MRNYWTTLSPLGRAIHLLLLAAILAFIAFNIYVTPASADGYEGDVSYKDVVRVQPSAYRRDRDDSIRSYLTKSELRELRRIKERAEARRLGRRVAAYRDEPLAVRYVDRKTGSDSLYIRRGDRECRSPIEVTGHERLGRARAEQSAHNAWRTAASDRYGFRFAAIEGARNVRMSCSKIRGSTFGVFVCAVRARPCKDL